jgi:hypothetical protein
VRLDPEQLTAVHDRASKLGMTVTGYLQSVIVADQYPAGIRQIGQAMMECADIVRRALGVSDWYQTEQSRDLTMQVLSNILLMEFAAEHGVRGDHVSMTRLLPKRDDPNEMADMLTRLAHMRNK